MIEIPLGFLGIVLYVFSSIWATRRTITYTSGAATPIWLVVIWLVAPCFGSIAALIAIKKTDPS
ncbi:MAG: hypothetical protein AAF191_00100 [Verrucomicrobiota bacterium]